MGAHQPAAQLLMAIDEMLARSTIPDAEEWAIHDYDDFGAIRLSEFESMETVARIAASIADHGAAYSVFSEIVGNEAGDALRCFENHYQARYASMDAFKRALAADSGRYVLSDGRSCLHVSIKAATVVRDIGHGMCAIDSDGRGLFLLISPCPLPPAAGDATCRLEWPVASRRPE